MAVSPQSADEQGRQQHQQQQPQHKIDVDYLRGKGGSTTTITRVGKLQSSALFMKSVRGSGMMSIVLLR